MENDISFFTIPPDTRSTEQIQKDSQQFIALSQEDRQIPQRTPRWYKARLEMVTASDWATAVGKNPYQSRNSLLMKKQTQDSSFSGSSATMWGQKYEPVATSIYEHMSGKTVAEFGLLPHPQYSYLGASPDGITKDGIMIEIKCPSSREINGIPPSYYWMQVQGQLEICDLEVCHFLECRIKEYCSEVDYWKDVQIDQKDTMKENQFFSGVILRFLNKQILRTTGETETKRMYSPVNTFQTPEELENWIQKTIQEMDSSIWLEESEERTYWCCDLVSIQEIKRDREWFKNTLIQLQQFWIEVLYGRIGYLQLKQQGSIVEMTPEERSQFQNVAISMIATPGKRSTTSAKKTKSTVALKPLPRKNGFQKKADLESEKNAELEKVQENDEEEKPPVFLMKRSAFSKKK